MATTTKRAEFDRRMDKILGEPRADGRGGVIDVPDIQDIQVRLYEAIRTLHALPDRERKWIYGRMCNWPDTLREAVHIYAAALERLANKKTPFEDMREPPYVPTKEAIDRLDETLRWLTWLDKRELELITARAFKRAWLKIAWKYGRSDTTVQTWHRQALEKVRGRLLYGGPPNIFLSKLGKSRHSAP